MNKNHKKFHLSNRLSNYNTLSTIEEMAERLEPASLREYENCIKLLRDSDAYICCWP